ncbi:hypothetical protein Tco_0008260 [Tanacetum coccineum]
MEQYLFLLGRKEIAMIPSEKKSQVPKAEVKLEENILKTKVVEDDVEKIQDLHICEQHDNKVSTLVLETTKEVSVLKSCEDVVGSKNNEELKICNCDLNTNPHQHRLSIPRTRGRVLFEKRRMMKGGDKEIYSVLCGSWGRREEMNERNSRDNVKRKATKDEFVVRRCSSEKATLEVKAFASLSCSGHGTRTRAQQLNKEYL